MPQSNQQDIADRLGLSRATVSRCFTNHAGISPVTRAKVFQVASEIGYIHMESRTSSGNKVRAKSKTGTRFSVLICSDPNEYFSGDYESPGEQILAGVSEYGQLHDIGIEVNVVPPDALDLEAEAYQEIEGLRDRSKRGVLLIYPFPPKVIDQLALRFPIATLVDQSEQHSIDCVDVDHHAGIASIIEHLHAAGHRRIGFYTREYPHQATWSFRRYSAFVETMARLKIRIPTKDVIGMFPEPAVGTEEGIAMAAERTRQGVTAWVCAADHQAYDLIHGLREHHQINTPADVSVTGFDGIHHPTPSAELTTVEIPFRAIGMIGAERVAARMQKLFSRMQHTYISGELRHGATVAPPKS